MRNFQDTLETSKGSFISAFSICMTVPLTPLALLVIAFWLPDRWISTQRYKTFPGTKLCANHSFTLQQKCYGADSVPAFQ